MTNEAEQAFLKDASKSFIISLGMKRQGKTFLMLRYIRWALAHREFDEYHLILPQFGQERDGAYQFLNGMKNVFIYDKYHQVVCDRILKLMSDKHLFFCIDDASGELLQNFDTSITKLLTCNEHGKTCCVWFNIHSAKRVLPPIGRQMLNYLFLYNVDDGLLLKGIWEERFSRIFRKFDEFLQVYDQAMQTEKNAIMYALSKKHEMEGICNWDLIKNETPLRKPMNKSVKQPQQTIKQHPMLSMMKSKVEPMRPSMRTLFS